MRLGNVHGQPGDEVEDVQLDWALAVRAVGIDAHRGVIAVIGDTRHHDGSSEHVSGDSGERYLVVRCDGFPDVAAVPSPRCHERVQVRVETALPRRTYA